MSLKDTTTTSRPQIPPPQQTRSSSSSSATVKSAYLTLYNFASAVLWVTVLARTIMTVNNGRGSNWSGWVSERFGGKGQYFGNLGWGKADTYAVTGEFVKWTQTLALVEVVHSLFGIVRAPILTTFLQVASRIILVWGIVDQFPSQTSHSPAYSTMLLAWSATEVVRYSYFVFFLNGSVPGVLQWLRYNGFFLLYPMGISSEMWLVWLASELAGKRDERLKWVLYAVLGLYVPGAYVLYTHMMAQRRRIMRGKAKARN